jgi:U2 small nuclear ribonucleoprotein B''
VGQPNKILFVQGLPEATTSAMLAMLFQQFPGFEPAGRADHTHKRCVLAPACHPSQGPRLCLLADSFSRARLRPPRSYAEVRMVEAKPGIAFVEFETELQAGVALTGLGGFKITPTHSMAVTYAKQ